MLYDDESKVALCYKGYITLKARAEGDWFA